MFKALHYKCRMSSCILLVIAGHLLLLLLNTYQTDARIHEGTNTSSATNRLKSQDHRKNWREKLHSIKGFLQGGAEDFNEIKHLKDEEYARRKTIFANYKDFLVTNRTIPLISGTDIFENLQGYPETNRDGKKINSFKTAKHQQQLDTTNVRSSRQRRTLHTQETKLVCQEKLSCRNRCQNPRTVSYQAQLLCFCDEDCELFKDCCADYDDFCGTNGQNVTNSTTQNTRRVENLVNQENRDLWTFYKGEDVKGTLGIWMIGSCPSSWPEDDVSYRCRNLSQTNKVTIENYRYLPVYTSNGRVYHNRFCAQCNGVSPKNLSGGFSLSIECDFTPPRHLNLESTISYLISYCQRRSNGISWSPKKKNPRRYRLDFRLVIWSSRFSIDQNISLAKCLTGKPRIVTSGYSVYRNIDCAKCHNRINQISCGPNITATDYGKPKETFLATTKPFSVIFDFNRDNTKGQTLMQIKTPCPSEKVYDHHLDICRYSIPAVPSSSDSYKYRVILWLNPPLDLWSYKADDVYRQAIAQALAVPFKDVKNIETTKNISFTLQLWKNESLQAKVRNLLDFKSPFNINITGFVHTVIKATARILSCVNRQKYDRSEYTVLQDGTSAVSIKKTGEVLQSTDYYINTTEPSASVNDSQAIFVCRQHQISNCSGVYILINEGEFRVLVNKSIFVNASKQVYDCSEYTWINKSVLVCENFSSTYYKTKVVPANDDPLLTAITLVCMSLSIIGLVFLLVTYSLFSELRTPPGINLMNLSASILLAQLLWILGSGQTDTSMACTVIAVILHYLFLVSFMWTSIIAFDTWRAFSAENRAFSTSNHEKYMQVLRHMAVGWLLTLAYVSICVVLDITDTVNIGYKSRMACWMANKWAILYFFAVPVFLCLVFNMVFCVMTFRAIKVTTAQASAATDHNTKNNFGIYVRIASLMGFTWIFGFAAPFGWQFLWYPFVILNGLQGVYIVLAFPLSKRARGLYKRLIKGRSSSNETSNNSFSKTKTSHTDLNRSGADTTL